MVELLKRAEERETRLRVECSAWAVPRVSAAASPPRNISGHNSALTTSFAPSSANRQPSCHKSPSQVMGKAYSEEQRLTVKGLLEAGRDEESIEKETGVSDRTIRRWKLELERTGRIGKVSIDIVEDPVHVWMDRC